MHAFSILVFMNMTETASLLTTSVERKERVFPTHHDDLEVKTSTSTARGPEFKSQPSDNQRLKYWRSSGYATLPDVWRCGVNFRAGLPGVSILKLGQVARWICDYCLSVS